LAYRQIGAVILSTTVILDSKALASRIQRVKVERILNNPQNINKSQKLAKFGVDTNSLGIVVTGKETICNTYAYTDSYSCNREFVIDGPTPADAEMLVYFTSGTTSEPKMVLHTQQSYSVGHFSTLYWLGVDSDD